MEIDYSLSLNNKVPTFSSFIQIQTKLSYFILLLNIFKEQKLNKRRNCPGSDTKLN